MVSCRGTLIQLAGASIIRDELRNKLPLYIVPYFPLKNAFDVTQLPIDR